ncbi:MAG: hypothetical protein IPL71_03985 [Anaerolineales bacterium]|uniref:hypothetical protein n=1 Tax=Candidatus Villigracilis proximus TaxID=3140683 RepID=UPI00313756DD|nr:hypothetical protein [Anaerolineales bacterium]
MAQFLRWTESGIFEEQARVGEKLTKRLIHFRSHRWRGRSSSGCTIYIPDVDVSTDIATTRDTSNGIAVVGFGDIFDFFGVVG